MTIVCNRLRGGSVADCACRLPNGTWLKCPPEARGINPHPRFSGDFCHDCGSDKMMRTGTCLTCLNCGSTSGGCS